MFGLSLNFISWISRFLSDRTISVCVDGALSEALPINSGVPQGSVISPTLFLLFINDLLSSTRNPIHAFADDSTLHSSSTYSSSKANIQSLTTDRASTINSINTDLDSILSWGSDNLVAFNQSKTKSLAISNKSQADFPLAEMSDTPLPHSKSLCM